MKQTLHSLALVSGCCAALLALTPGAARGQGAYFSANLGVALAEDVDLDEYLVPTPGAKLKLDSGVRLSVAGGYNFNPYLGAEVETGFIYNSVSGVAGGGSVDASLSHVPLLVNLVLRYDQPGCKWVPYAGAGIGGDAVVLTLDDVAGVNGTDSDVVFAWQAFAGLRYKFNPNMSLGAGYKYYSSEGASWDVFGASGGIEIGRSAIHSIGVDFNMKF